MFRFNACKECFKVSVDDTASDHFLLLSDDSVKCDICNNKKPVVIQYFKYGECSVTPDNKKLKQAVAHRGVNPNYSYWGTEDPYK